MKKKINEVEMNADEIQTFQDMLFNGEVKFKFKKVKDGTTRKARGTLDPETIEKGLSSQAIDKTKKKRAVPDSIIIYWDLDKKMYRSFRKENFIGYV